MIAYNRKDTENQPAPYTPNLFIRIGLFIVTIVLVIFALGLLSLLLLDSLGRHYGVLLLVASFLCYGLLEIFIRQKGHFHSGVDDALRWSALTLFISGWVGLMDRFSPLVLCILVFVSALYCCLRFADRWMALLAYAGLIGILFYGLGNQEGVYSRLACIILTAVVSLTTHAGARSLQSRAYDYYVPSLHIIRIASLVSLYLSGNYFIVREISGSGASVPFGWLFWLWTALLPFIYICRGIQKKDRILLDTGLFLIAALIFTVRYYHHFLSAELAMVIGGSLLLILSYSLIRYLRTPRHGFTYKEEEGHPTEGGLRIESLIIAETFNKTGAAPSGDGFHFGGGSGGGGGAGGEY